MTTVYVDSVFVLNALMDYLLLLCTGRLAGVTLRRGRYALAAVLGGAYAVAVFLPGCGFLALLPAKAAAGVVLAVAAFGGEARLGRLMLLFSLGSNRRLRSQQAMRSQMRAVTMAVRQTTSGRSPYRKVGQAMRGIIMHR